MKKHSVICSFLFAASVIITGCGGEKYRLFVGGFNRHDEKGMSIFDFNTRTGELVPLAQADVGPAPSFFCYSEKNSLFYVINEVMEFKGEFGGGLTTLEYNAEDATFERKNEILIPYAGPCHISMSPDSGYLFIANYPNGSVAVVRLNETGIPEAITDTILYNKPAPDESHAHMILSDPSGKKIYVTDLGLDRIMIYDFDKGKGELNLVENGIVQLPAGMGPRHFVFNREGSRLYVINELGSTIMTFEVSTDGGLRLLQTLPTVRESYMENNYCADIHISNNGRYIYGSNRGENTIVTFSIEQDGTLALAGHTSCGGNWPRNFTPDPSGKFILVGNQKSDSISVFRLDAKTGLPKEPAVNYKVTAPACLKFF